MRSRFADAGEGGKRIEDMATRAATTKATEVKKPKTFWTRTSEECIFFLVCEGRVVGGLSRHGGWFGLGGCALVVDTVVYCS